MCIHTSTCMSFLLAAPSYSPAASRRGTANISVHMIKFSNTLGVSALYINNVVRNIVNNAHSMIKDC